MSKRLGLVALMTAAAVVSFPEVGGATIIGDDVTFQCTNCGPPTLDTFTVLDGLPELTLFSQFEVDVEEDYLQINWIFSSDFIIPDLNFLWTSLDFGSPILGVSVDPTSTWGLSPLVSLSFTADSVSLVNNADRSVVPGDFIKLNVETAPVPEPGTLSLIGLGLAGLLRRRLSRG